MENERSLPKKSINIPLSFWEWQNLVIWLAVSYVIGNHFFWYLINLEDAKQKGSNEYHGSCMFFACMFKRVTHVLDVLLLQFAFSEGVKCRARSYKKYSSAYRGVFVIIKTRINAPTRKQIHRLL